MTDNQNLLTEYLQTGSDAAYRELVTRYVDLVYSTAVRLVAGDTHLAEDVTQTVFVDLRNSAKRAFGDLTMEAIKKYAQANNGMLPGDLSQLKPFYEKPVEDAILSRYSLLQTGKLADLQREYVLGENAPPVDDDYDSRYEWGMHGTHSINFSEPGDVVWQGVTQFAKAHDGLLPTDASQLSPYLNRPVDQAKVQGILSSLPSGVTTLEQLRAVGQK